MSYCGECGHQLGDGRFCNECGAERRQAPPPGPTTPPPSAGSRFPLYADGRPSPAHGGPTIPPPVASAAAPPPPPPAEPLDESVEPAGSEAARGKSHESPTTAASDDTVVSALPRWLRGLRNKGETHAEPAPTSASVGDDGSSSRTQRVPRPVGPSRRAEPVNGTVAAESVAHTQTLVALRTHGEGLQPSLAETAVHPSRAIGGLLPAHDVAPVDERAAMRASLTDPTWLTYLGVLVAALVIMLILGILLVVS